MMKYRILHITKDDKFFDRLITAFDSDKRVESRCVVINELKKPFKYITFKDRVISVTIAELKRILKEGNYDAVYYHSIPETVWRTVLWIPREKKIIWWSWGYDLYRSRLPYFRPLFTLKLYKKQTDSYYNENYDVSECPPNGLFKRLLALMKSRYLERCRRQALSRIDYYIPVIPEEYELLKNQYSFEAKQFANPWTENDTNFKPSSDYVIPGNILLGNSASISNNHLDVWKSLMNAELCNRTIIIPVNYGNVQYRDFLKRAITSESNKIVFLQELLSYDEYNKMLDSCRFALFGVIRQQALGNVELCLKRGIKMFFFEDSMVYRFLKNIGCYVYTIERLNQTEISTPLSACEAEHNYQLWKEYQESRLHLYNSVIDKLVERL